MPILPVDGESNEWDCPLARPEEFKEGERSEDGCCRIAASGGQAKANFPLGGDSKKTASLFAGASCGMSAAGEPSIVVGRPPPLFNRRCEQWYVIDCD